MKLLIQFSGEHPTLPYAEFEGVLRGEGLKHKLLEEYSAERLVVAKVKAEHSSFLTRLALARRVCSYVGSSADLDVLADNLYPLLNGGSFKVSCKSMRVSERLGGILHGRGLRVDVHAPDAVVEVFLADRKFHAGIRIPLNQDFEKRKPQHRPFFHPTSMHPKFARALVNLAEVKAGETLLDPFCGTGGILIEAGLMGVNVAGLDIDEKMVEGCKKNLDKYKIKGDIQKGDARSSVFQADAIATDPPYGRSSFVSGKDPISLYVEFIENAAKHISPGRCMVLMAPQHYDLDFPGLDEKAHIDLRMHKSLTRRIWVLTKK
ncbi:MAG: DNA methyltransferase [Candidatus Altiarchaeota archaeon]